MEWRAESEGGLQEGKQRAIFEWGPSLSLNQVESYSPSDGDHLSLDRSRNQRFQHRRPFVFSVFHDSNVEMRNGENGDRLPSTGCVEYLQVVSSVTAVETSIEEAGSQREGRKIQKLSHMARDWSRLDAAPGTKTQIFTRHTCHSKEGMVQNDSQGLDRYQSTCKAGSHQVHHCRLPARFVAHTAESRQFERHSMGQSRWGSTGGPR